MERVLCLIYKEMAEFEVIFALNILGYNPDIMVCMIAEEKGPLQSKAGITYMPDFTIKEALDLTDVEGLIIPGGWSDEQSPELTQLICKLDEEEKMLAAICRGPSYLARAGALDTVKYTTTYTEELANDLGVEDPFDRENFIDENVVVDGRFITAKGFAFIDFAVEILDYFEMFEDDDDKDDFAREHKGL
ncbi:MAG: DJ-1/PfpI family protein [Spirochaetales bacterium]|nr:DJ-1/PfpI family protein [Spirochaetales bacterium]